MFPTRGVDDSSVEQKPLNPQKMRKRIFQEENVAGRSRISIRGDAKLAKSQSTIAFAKKISRTIFLNPNHDYCVAETGYLADKAGPTAPDKEYTILGF